MLELAEIARELGDPGRALSFQVWADDALAAGAPYDQPVDPALAPPPTVGRIAIVLVEQAGKAGPDGAMLSSLPAPAAVTTA
jgi:hypothetical protein